MSKDEDKEDYINEVDEWNERRYELERRKICWIKHRDEDGLDRVGEW